MQGWLWYFDKMPGIVFSTPDAVSYLYGANFRLPLYCWIVQHVSMKDLVFLQGLAFAGCCVLLYKSAGKWAALAWMANLSAAAISFHALTESFSVLAVCSGLYFLTRKQWIGLAASIWLLMALRPIVPLPFENFKEMAAINAERFWAQVATCENYFGNIGATVWVWRTNVLNNLFSISNFALHGWRIAAMIYNSVIWILFIAVIHRIDLRLVLIISYLILISGMTNGQGDRIMMIALPVAIFGIAQGKMKTGQQACGQ